jgi:hypothetical protein
MGQTLKEQLEAAKLQANEGGKANDTPETGAKTSNEVGGTIVKDSVADTPNKATPEVATSTGEAKAEVKTDTTKPTQTQTTANKLNPTNASLELQTGAPIPADSANGIETVNAAEQLAKAKAHAEQAEREYKALQGAMAPLLPFTPKAGDYKAIRLTSIIKAKGQRVLPNKHGYYTNPDEETKELLEEFAARGLVEKVTAKK